jgi:hypothetical protein
MAQAQIQTLEDARKYLTPAEFAELESLLREKAKHVIWVPSPKQLEVVENKADVIGYGGAAGGGKSHLGSGLSVTAHQRSAIIRPQKNQTQKFVLEIAKIIGNRDGYNSQHSAWTFSTPDKVERFIRFFGMDTPEDAAKQQGEDFDLKFYDEVTQMLEADVRYTLTWNRTDDPNQRVRAVLAFNPPDTPEGRWVIKYFAPWLDPSHPNPAKDGELRYFTTVGEDQDYEVSSPQAFILKFLPNGDQVPWYSFDRADYPPEQIITPESRTFIHARVTDNPYYMRTNYLQKLQALPEPLRSQMMNGDFFAGMKDDARQVIPSAWVLAAQNRWRERHALIHSGAVRLGEQDSLGADVARGGNMGAAEITAGGDELVVSARYGSFWAELEVAKGLDINDGAKAAAVILGQRRDEAPVHIDVIGVGTSPYDFLTTNGVYAIAVNGTAGGVGTDASGLLQFFNKRAELHWRMRERLDPAHPDPAALPPDPQLLGDLTAARWWLGKSGIQIESNDDIKKRLGRSPDRGAAVILANINSPKRKSMLGGYMNLPQAGESYEERRLKELEG